MAQKIRAKTKRKSPKIRVNTPQAGAKAVNIEDIQSLKKLLKKGLNGLWKYMQTKEI